MIDRNAFFATVRASLFTKHPMQSQVDGLTILLDGWEKRGGGDRRCLAYALATAYHETAYTMQPIDERGGDAYFERRYGPEGDNPARARRMGNIAAGDGARYHGRGFVQLTWRRNYALMSQRLTFQTGVPVDLEARPELALRPDYAAEILYTGLEEGVFTGKRLADYFTGKTSNWRAARRIVNGLDHAEDIAGYAHAFAAALGCEAAK